jgi:hypothetical protein
VRVVSASCEDIATETIEPGLEDAPVLPQFAEPEFSTSVRMTFYQPTYNSSLKKIILHVIDAERPIHEEPLIRRIAREHGFQRSGRQIRERVLAVADAERTRTQEGVGHFYWPGGMEDNPVRFARSEGRDEDVRKLDYICTEELREILRKSNDDGTYIAFSQALGIGRLTQQMRDRLDLVRSQRGE